MTQLCDFCSKKTATYRCADCGTFLCARHVGTVDKPKNWLIRVPVIVLGLLLIPVTAGLSLALSLTAIFHKDTTEKKCTRCSSTRALRI
jgi:hypothetical protein